MVFPYSRRLRTLYEQLAAEANRLKIELAELRVRMNGLEDERTRWVTRAADIVDRLTAMESRQRTRKIRAERAEAGEGLDVLDFKRGGDMRGWK